MSKFLFVMSLLFASSVGTAKIFNTALPLYAEFFSDEQMSFAFDFPDGFALTGVSPNGNAYSLQNAIVSAEAIVRVYAKDEMPSAARAMQDVFSKLDVQGEIGEFFWQNELCAIAEFILQKGYTEKQTGWALATPLPETGGALVTLVFAPQSAAKNLQPFFLSTLDSLYINSESWLSCGPVTSFAFPAGEQKTIALHIGTVSVTTRLGVEDTLASEFVIEREIDVLALYADTDAVMSAWQRYYRQIYRDSYGRLKTVAHDISAALEEKNTGNVAREEYLLRTLLSWTQEFVYTRDFSASDFTPLPLILEGGGSDCDSRSMLLSVILNNAGCNTLLFFSPAYKHAVLGINSALGGMKITVSQTPYLLCETTTRVAPGIIIKEMSDAQKWIPVIFPQ